jgi:hypothetical protein
MGDMGEKPELSNMGPVSPTNATNYQWENFLLKYCYKLI